MRFLIPFVLLTAAPLAAQSTWIQVDVPPESATAAWLEAEGFVIEPMTPDARDFIDLIVPDTDLPRFAATGLPYRVIEHSRPLWEVLRTGRAIDPQFYTWGELNQYMLNVQNAHPALAKRFDLNALTGTGLTHENRTIYAIKISDNVAADEDEPQVLFVGNHHSREIATPHQMVDIMDHLTDLYGVDPEVTDWVNSHEIWIAPTWNPDGLEYVWNVDQYWRKNRRNNGGGVYGVDLNRNYPFLWAVCGSYSHSPSSDVYVGPAPGSEPETKTMLALARLKRFAKVIDTHSSGQEVLYSYACAALPAAVQQKINAVRDQLAAAASYSTRVPSAGGEHFDWETQEIGALSYLLETHTTFFPTWSTSLSENLRVRAAMRLLLDLPISLSGHVYDAWTGAPLSGATVSASGLNFSNGETRQSGSFGRFHFWVNNGSYSFTFDGASHFPRVETVTVGSAGAARDVFLNPDNRPYVVLEGTPAVGQQIRFRMWNALAYSGMKFTIMASSSGGGPFVAGFTVGGLTVPLTYDFITNFASTNPAKFQGTLNASGFGNTPYQTLPPAGAGLHIWIAGVVTNGSGVHQIVTPAADFQIS